MQNSLDFGERVYNNAIDSGKNYLDNKLEQYNNCTSNFCRGFVSGEFGGEVATSTGLLFAGSEATVGKTIGKSVDNIAEGVGKNTGRIENVAPAAAIDTVPATRPDFYVKPNGDVVPSTGYRYMKSEYAEETMKTMNSGPNKDYFGFNKYDTGSEARDAYQIAPHWSDARLRGEFDTLQVIDDMRVPKTFGDEGPDLEPFTTSYPQYGKGGELQFIYDKGYIKFDKVDLLEDK